MKGDESAVVSRLVQQAGVLPFRWKGKKLQFCLITSRRAGRWTLPKGTIEAKETHGECAEREAVEEAGLRGEILQPELGSFLGHRGKRKSQVLLMLMRVQRCSSNWPEKKKRTRRWFTAKKAIKRIGRDEITELIRLGIKRIGRRKG